MPALTATTFTITVTAAHEVDEIAAQAYADELVEIGREHVLASEGESFAVKHVAPGALTFTLVSTLSDDDADEWVNDLVSDYRSLCCDDNEVLTLVAINTVNA